MATICAAGVQRFQSLGTAVEEACPTISVPCGMTKEGLSVGVQLMAPPRAEYDVLGAAAVLERQTGLAQQVPRDPA